MTSPQLPKKDSPYELLISQENFELAWKRVRYFDRPDSRDWIGLKVFSANVNANLEYLRKTIIERTFQPTFPEIKFLPKPSLTLRPMAIMPIRDRIVFQAISNVIAEYSRAALTIVANRQSFANILAEPTAEKMFAPWKIQYKNYQETFRKLIKEGNNWAVETDAAAFYETVDHNLLFNDISENYFLDDRSLEYLKLYLPFWCSINKKQVSKGIPQGCLASDLLANVFLYSFDRELALKDFYYLRYVDDIRILAKTQEAVQKGLIAIDMNLKGRGIILQTKKTQIREIINLDEETDRLANQLSELDRRLNEPQLPLPDIDPLTETSVNDAFLLGDEIDQENKSSTMVSINPDIQEQIIKLFWESKRSIDSNFGDQFSERHLRFCLYRLLPDSDIVNAVLPYFIERPWLSELLSLYMKRNKLEREPVKFLTQVIKEHSVYDNIVSQAIDVLVNQGVSLRDVEEYFRGWVCDDKRQWPLLTNSLLALGSSSENMTVLIKGMNSSNYFVRRMALIQALRLARNKDEAMYIFKIGIRDCSDIVVETLLFLLYVEWGMNLNDLGVKDTDISDYCYSLARGYDNSLPEISPDYIRNVFETRYRVTYSDVKVDFHELLNSHYERACEFLWQSEISYSSNPSRYVSQLDLFHEEILYPIMVGKFCIKNTEEELAKTEFGDRINMLNKKNGLGVFQTGVRSCHKLRCSSPEAHTRLHSELTMTSPINWRQRENLRKTLSAGYQELVEWISLGCFIS